MAAGLGFKTFTTGEVLSAANVNGYLMQGILVFATAAARDAAITSPQEGQFAFLKDSDSTVYYNGTAWAASAGGGMTLLSTTALSGASVSVTSISAAYTDLLIIVSMLSTSADGIITGTLNSNTTAGVYQLNSSGNTSIPFTRGLNNDSAGTSAQNWVTTVSQYASTTFHKPLSITAGFVNAATGAQVTYADGGTFKSNTAVSSFQIATSAGTFDAGNIYIYGVK